MNSFLDESFLLPLCPGAHTKENQLAFFYLILTFPEVALSHGSMYPK